MSHADRYISAEYLNTVRQFFSSEVRMKAIRWFCLLIGLLLTLNGLNVLNSFVGRDFMTAISDRRPRQFVTYAFVYAGVFACLTVADAFYRFSEERLRLLWRTWLTGSLIDRYMSNDTFYRLQTNVEIDNPDERITEDVKSYTQTTLSFFLLSLNALITSLAFLGVLWSITPRLVIAAVVYAGAGSAAAIILGRPLVRLANLQLRKEADLRYHLIQTRETAETIATMRAEPPVRDCLHQRLGAVVANSKITIAVTRNLGFFIKGYNYMTQLIPLLIVAPLYMRGEVEFGVVTQSAMAFSQFLGAFSLIITQFETISSFAAVTDRLNRISKAIDQPQLPARQAIEFVEDDTRVAYEGLSLWGVSEQQPLVRDLTLAIPHGTNVLVTGSDATAKTALFLATALVWEKGKGRVIRPARDKMYFISQRPLFIPCGLRSQLGLTSPGSRFSDDQLSDVLHKVGLESLPSRIGGWDTEQDWSSSLSQGEARLLAIARVLLTSPSFVFLERMDGELTWDQVEQVYHVLSDSGISYLTIGDNDQLRAFHDTILQLNGGGAWRTLSVVETAAIKR
jgi:vitamin B12/bleomycin/antimicrobial peptide transport system ATP-binding/permease protein